MSPSLLSLALLVWALPVQVHSIPHQPPQNGNFYPPKLPPAPCGDLASTVTVTASSVETVTITSSTLSFPSPSSLQKAVVTVTVTEAGLRVPPFAVWSQPAEIQTIQTVTVTAYPGPQQQPQGQPQPSWGPDAGAGVGWDHELPNHDDEDPAWGPDRGPLVQTVTVTEPAGSASAPASTMDSISVVTVTRPAPVFNHPHNGNGWPHLEDGWRYSDWASHPKPSISVIGDGLSLDTVTVTMSGGGDNRWRPTPSFWSTLSSLVNVNVNVNINIVGNTSNHVYDTFGSLG